MAQAKLNTSVADNRPFCRPTSVDRRYRHKAIIVDLLTLDACHRPIYTYTRAVSLSLSVRQTRLNERARPPD